MLLLAQPTDERIRRFIAGQCELAFSYVEVGATRDTLPTGYVVDHNRVLLGHGTECFERAKSAVRRWTMFDIGWVKLCWPDSPIQPGTTVAVLGRVLGLWSMNACRVVYAIDEPGEVERFGFAYGTLPEHVERGEERFSVEWNHADGSVWYDILAFSRPNQLLSRTFAAWTRHLQKQFAADSLRAMQRAVKT